MNHSVYAQEQTTVSVQEYVTAQYENKEADSDIPAGFDEFPNLHPLVVHFTIVLLLLAFLSQITSFLVPKKPLSYITMVLLLGGFIGGIQAAKVFHVHPMALSDHVNALFESHEKFANWTLWLTGISLTGKVINSSCYLEQ